MRSTAIVQRVITIAPHRFTEQDARRTIESFEPLWQQLTFGRPGADRVLEPLRPSLSGDTEIDLPAVWHALRSAGPSLRAAGLLPTR